MHTDITELKKAKTQYPLIDVIKNRWSPRSFSEKAITKNDLQALFEAASWAPSSMNEQPWQYIYAHKSENGFQNLVDCLKPGNQPWAKNAAVLVVSLARKHFSTGKDNRNAMHDTGLANMQLALQAMSMDIYTHMMAGFERQKTMDTFQLPENVEVVCFMALGYLDSPEKLPEPFKTREMNERNRKNIAEFTFHHAK
jgi:nitroreductase